MAMVDSWVSELGDEIINRIPDRVDYVEMRRHTLGSSLVMAVTRIGHEQQIPPEILRSPVIGSLADMASDYVGLVNDIVSHQKEIEFEGELHNGVLTVQQFSGAASSRPSRSSTI
jgi:germacradienol/geosmin synthase